MSVGATNIIPRPGKDPVILTKRETLFVAAAIPNAGKTAIAEKSTSETLSRPFLNSG